MIILIHLKIDKVQKILLQVNKALSSQGQNSHYICKIIRIIIINIRCFYFIFSLLSTWLRSMTLHFFLILSFLPSLMQVGGKLYLCPLPGCQFSTNREGMDAGRLVLLHCFVWFLTCNKQTNMCTGQLSI